MMRPMMSIILSEAKMTSDFDGSDMSVFVHLPSDDTGILTSPNNLTPRKFNTTMKTAKMVIHAAGGTGVFQNCKIVAAALMSVGTTIAIVYPARSQRVERVSHAH